MQNPLTKAYRTVRRDYFNGYNSLFGSVCALGILGGAVCALGVGAAAVGGASVGVMAATVAGIGGAAVAAGILLVTQWLQNGSEHSAKLADPQTQKEVTIVGAPRKVAALLNTQLLICALTDRYQHKGELPDGLAEKLAAYWRDAAEAARDVKAFDAQGAQLRGITLSRNSFNKSGKLEAEGVVSLPVGAPPAPPSVVANPDVTLDKGVTVKRTITLKKAATGG